LVTFSAGTFLVGPVVARHFPHVDASRQNARQDGGADNAVLPRLHFGSGKSSCAKNLGYALQNRIVLGRKFADLFMQQKAPVRKGRISDCFNRPIETRADLT